MIIAHAGVARSSRTAAVQPLERMEAQSLDYTNRIIEYKSLNLRLTDGLEIGTLKFIDQLELGPGKPGFGRIEFFA